MGKTILVLAFASFTAPAAAVAQAAGAQALQNNGGGSNNPSVPAPNGLYLAQYHTSYATGNQLLVGQTAPAGITTMWFAYTNSTSTAYKLRVEAQPVGAPFLNAATAVSSSAVANGVITVAVFEHSKMDFHWQACLEDSAGNFGGWTPFSSNGENMSDYSINTDVWLAKLDLGTTPGWTFTNNHLVIKWAVRTPPPGVTAYSASKVLNFSNGTDYFDGSRSATADDDSQKPPFGSVYSVPSNLSGISNPQLSYWCSNNTESGDTLTAEIVSFSTPTLVYISRTLKPGTTCSSAGAWHQHQETLNSGWDKVRLKFTFVPDGVGDLLAGPTFDNIGITASPGGGGGGGGGPDLNDGKNGDENFLSICGGGPGGEPLCLWLGIVAAIYARIVRRRWAVERTRAEIRDREGNS